MRKSAVYIYLLFTGFFGLSLISADAQDLKINEIVSSNSQSAPGTDGNYYDWIELYNPTDKVAHLKEYNLAEYDNLNEKWPFPDRTLDPHSFFLVYASGLDTLIGREVHADFKIKSSGEALVLTFATGQVADYLEAVDLKENESYGRLPDGSGTAFVFSRPTPLASNTTADPWSKISLSHQPGFYNNEISLTLQNNNGDSIYYSLDGSEPVPGSDGTYLYDAPLGLKDRSGETNEISAIPTAPDLIHHRWKAPENSVFKAHVLRARSYRRKEASSDMFTGTFFINRNMSSRYTLPLLSLVTPMENLFAGDSGIYVPGDHFDPLEDPYKSGNYLMEGGEWERPVHMEFFNTGGSLEFAQNFGIRIQGGNSRLAPQKSLKVYARSEYGKSRLEYALFPDLEITSYKRFLLQTCDPYYKKAIFLDDVIHDLSSEYTDGMASRPCILFINGEYWGLHRIREHIDKYYLASHFKVDKDEIDLLKASWSMVIEGSNTDYKNLINFIKTNDLSDEASFIHVSSRIDVDNLIDYFATELVFSNYDWPMGNIKYWKEQAPGARWRWLLYDLDAGFRNPEYNMLQHATKTGGTLWPNPDHATLLFRSLLQNPGFTDQFVSRLNFLITTPYHRDRILNTLNEYQAVYEPELKEHFERWPTTGLMEDWLTDIHKSQYFARSRAFYLKSRMQEFFGLDSLPIAEVPITSEFIVFPNPTRDLLVLEFKEINTSYTQTDLFDMYGHLVYSEKLETGHKVYTLNLAYLPAGSYHLRVISRTSEKVRQIVILE